MKIIVRLMALVAFVTLSASQFSTNAIADEPVWTKGTVKKVNPDQGKVTIRHGEIKNLDMPGMTMIFRVADPKMLEGLKPKQKLEFYVVDENGRMVIKQIK